MLFNGPVRAATVAAALMLAFSANVYAENPRKEVRVALQDECDAYEGKDHRVCMRHAARTMQDLKKEAKSEYKNCLDQGYTRSECNEDRKSFWLNQLVY